MLGETLSHISEELFAVELEHAGGWDSHRNSEEVADAIRRVRR
jgi:hypothetical protein